MIKRSPLLVVLSVALLAGGAAFVHDLHSAPDDHHHGAGGDQLQLNDGQKWEADAPLRLGMERIRALVRAAKEDSSAGEMQALAEGIREHVDFLITNCKLAPKADATLHVVIADLLKGADLVTKGDVHRGISVMRAALGTYSKYFDDAG